jgi:hypothetical protein
VPPAPPPDPLTPGVLYPIIGPELATYGVVQPLARQLGLSILGTLDDRVGDTYEPDGCGVAPRQKACRPGSRDGLLARCFRPQSGAAFGQTLDNPYQAFADLRAGGNLGGFQGGIDLLRGPLIPGGYDRAGLYGAYGDVNADVNGLVTNPAAQGQILWQKVSFRHDYDGLGDVALGDTTGPSGRVGLRGKWTVVTPGGQVWQPYLRANLWRDWGAAANTVYSGTDVVQLASQTTMLELGGGLTGRINANVSVFANVDYEFAVGAAEGEKRNGVRGALGARYAW